MTTIASDVFPSASGTALIGSTSTSGHVWAGLPGSTDTMTITTNNGVKGPFALAGSGATAEAYINATPSGADYVVSCDLVVGGGSNFLTDFTGVIVRGSTSVDTKYRAYLSDNGSGNPQLSVDKIIAGTFTSLGTADFPTISVIADVLRITFTISGTTLTVNGQNITQGNGLASPSVYTDAAISSANKAGLLSQHVGGNTTVITAFSWTETVATALPALFHRSQTFPRRRR